MTKYQKQRLLQFHNDYNFISYKNTKLKKPVCRNCQNFIFDPKAFTASCSLYGILYAENCNKKEFSCYLDLMNANTLSMNCFKKRTSRREKVVYQN